MSEVMTPFAWRQSSASVPLVSFASTILLGPNAVVKSVKSDACPRTREAHVAASQFPFEVWHFVEDAQFARSMKTPSKAPEDRPYSALATIRARIEASLTLKTLLPLMEQRLSLKLLYASCVLAVWLYKREGAKLIKPLMYL